MTEGEYIDAVFRMATARRARPQLSAAERGAKAELSAAIMAMDAAEDVTGRHNLQEQVNVNEKLAAYGNALADLLRMEDSA